ncbi:hypothetical protein BECAL_02308 [Bellilinea caldifistulae]|uniref:Uncharacterized protein n=1 Tax=Bellilinea caldifistulae TaxID=360411 RepID=A0A0N8GLZ1_9CHLR|nr:hypothetical protein [Bellilinea caldifistulae]KPL73842.1 hypothetical protein AC812_13715 [Bellilinea caldifistulae]GAP11123.1 hypothetical protein BECAL_02308 [Bellilinea caldifistulae]
MKTPNLSVHLNNLSAVRETARRLGFTLSRGHRAGDGSIQQMLEAIAAGEVLVLCHVYDWPEDMRRDAAYLRGLAARIERDDNALAAAETLRGLAAAMEAAADLKSFE